MEMGFLTNLLKNKISKKRSKNTLAQDIAVASDWIVEALASSGYKADYTLESMKEIDRFFDEQNKPGGILAENRGKILFGIGSYIGQTAIKLYGGEWITDDSDSEGELNISVRTENGSLIFPVMKCMKRFQNGMEDSIYTYMAILNR